MKITLLELRQIIRDLLKEEAWMPGRWFPDSMSIEKDELDKLGDEGYGDFYDEDEDE